MSDYLKLVTGAGDQYLAALAETQETFLKSVATLSSWTPATPSSFATTSIPTPGFVPVLPTVQEVTEANFAFAAKLLKQQKDFTEKLLAATPAAR